MARPDFPRTIIELQRRYPDEDACRQYLFEPRWPGGFHCPRCGGEVATALSKRLLWQCSAGRYQVSVTAGTVLHRMRTPLQLCFWAAYLVTTATPGISALQQQRQLGLKRYETSWTTLHKLRRAMPNPESQPLTGEVEVDECSVGGHEAGLRSGQQHGIQALLIVAVETGGAGSGRIRMHVIDDTSADALCDFVTESAAAGLTVHADGWQGDKRLGTFGLDRQPRSPRAHRLLGEEPDEILQRVHRVVSHLRTWLQGTHRGVSQERLQVYLDEPSAVLTDAHPWPPSSECSAWARNSSPRPTKSSWRRVPAPPDVQRSSPGTHEPPHRTTTGSGATTCAARLGWRGITPTSLQRSEGSTPRSAGSPASAQVPFSARATARPGKGGNTVLRASRTVESAGYLRSRAARVPNRYRTSLGPPEPAAWRPKRDRSGPGLMQDEGQCDGVVVVVGALALPGKAT